MTDALKRSAAEAAVGLVESGMILALGTGSTVSFFLDLLGARLKRGDGGNYIVDCPFSPADASLAAKIQCHAGIIEHGIFLEHATEAIIGASGGIQRLTRSVLP